jgi:hypothetical protein
MPSPFPGMDPYLEGPAWESFHAAFIDDIGRQLAPKLRPKYVVRVERRFVADAMGTLDDLSIAEASTYPDVGIMQRDPSTLPPHHEGGVGVMEPPLQLATAITARSPQRSLTIVDVAERKLIAAIELLSPSNKRPGGGREEYIERRENFLAASVHLIEIDLLRRGARLPMIGTLPHTPYFAFLSRAGHRPMTGIWPISLRDALPMIPVPLLAGEADVPLDLQAAFNNSYDSFGFDLELDYRKPPAIPLDTDDRLWAETRLSAIL